MKKRVIWHTPEPASAAARYLREKVTALTAEGIAVHLVCPANYRFQEELGQNPLVKLHLTQARSLDTKRGFARKLWTNLRFLLSSAYGLFRVCGRDAIVHFQYVLHPPFCMLFFAAARLRGCKIVFTVHDPVPHKWLFPARLRWIERESLRWLYNASHDLIVHSKPGKKALMEKFGVSPDKVTIISHGPYELGAGNIPMPDSSLLELLLFGSIRENKGVHLAIEAVQMLYREGAAVRLTIAGEVVNGRETPYWERCCRLIAQEPGPIRIQKEFVPDERLPELFAGCHCLLLPYTNFSSDSGVAAMALANGRSIIATRAGGLGPLLDAAELGIAIEEATPGGVAAAIKKASSLGSSGLARLVAEGARYVNVECRWPKVASETRSVYARHQGAIDQEAEQLEYQHR